MTLQMLHLLYELARHKLPRFFFHLRLMVDDFCLAGLKSCPVPLADEQPKVINPEF